MRQQYSSPDEERGAKIIRLAIRLMAAGKARGYSDALRLAREKVKR
jgi:hypothetical protein